jgi:hypothetical protein
MAHGVHIQIHVISKKGYAAFWAAPYIYSTDIWYSITTLDIFS